MKRYFFILLFLIAIFLACGSSDQEKVKTWNSVGTISSNWKVDKQENEWKIGSNSGIVISYNFLEGEEYPRITAPKGALYRTILEDIQGVNKVLQFVGLPDISTTAKENSFETGNSKDGAAQYTWPHYEKGELTIHLRQETLPGGQYGKDYYTCIWKISIAQKK